MSGQLNGVEIARSTAIMPTADTVYTLVNGNTSAVIPIGRASFGSIRLVTNSAATTLTAYGSQTTTGADFEALYSDGAAVTITVSGTGWFELPAACLSVPFLQLRQNSGTVTARVYLKG